MPLIRFPTRFPARFQSRVARLGLTVALGLGLLTVTTACGQNSNGQATFTYIGNNSQPSGSEKITQKVPPLYNAQIWTVGSYWVWKERRSPKTAKCIRWLISEITAAGGATIEQKITQDCKTYEGVKANHFHFFPNSGEIDSSDYAGIAPGSKIFDHFYGDEGVATFYRMPQKFPWGGKASIYRIEGGKAWFLDAQETILQGALWQSETLQLVEFHDNRPNN